MTLEAFPGRIPTMNSTLPAVSLSSSSSSSSSSSCAGKHPAVTAICHKSWGPGHLCPSFNPPFFPSLSWTLQGVWAEPAHPLPHILIQFMQSNSLIKCTLMYNEKKKKNFFAKQIYRNQRVCRVQPLWAELILWITTWPCIAALH